MGGKETSRGIFCQALTSVIEALIDEKWDEISLEYETNADKVDIALFYEDKLNRAIQVKSSINAFEIAEVKQWIVDIYNDTKDTGIPAKKCQICLLGSVTGGVSDLSNALEKYYSNSVDKGSGKIINQLNIQEYENTEISIKILPVKIDDLMSMSRDKLNLYLSQKGIQLTQVQLAFVINAIITEKMKLSSTGKKISRDKFEDLIKNWVYEFKDYEIKNTNKVSIRSFGVGTENIHKEADIAICFLNMFEERELKSGLKWNEDVYSRLEIEINKLDDLDKKYELYINAHTSIAFSIGRLLNSKRGLDVCPIQRTSSGEKKWNINDHDSKEYKLWDVNYYERVCNSNINDCALLINVTHDIFGQVEEYLSEENLEVKKIINCSLENANNMSVTNGTHAKQLVDDIVRVLNKRKREERLGIVHIFISAPVSLTYYLGTVSKGFGSVVLYEYDFEKKYTATYSPAISFL